MNIHEHQAKEILKSCLVHRLQKARCGFFSIDEAKNCRRKPAWSSLGGEKAKFNAAVGAGKRHFQRVTLECEGLAYGFLSPPEEALENVREMLGKNLSSPKQTGPTGKTGKPPVYRRWRPKLTANYIFRSLSIARRGKVSFVASTEGGNGYRGPWLRIHRKKIHTIAINASVGVIDFRQRKSCGCL